MTSGIWWTGAVPRSGDRALRAGRHAGRREPERPRRPAPAGAAGGGRRRDRSGDVGRARRDARLGGRPGDARGRRRPVDGAEDDERTTPDRPTTTPEGRRGHPRPRGLVRQRPRCGQGGRRGQPRRWRPARSSPSSASRAAARPSRPRRILGLLPGQRHGLGRGAARLASAATRRPTSSSVAEVAPARAARHRRRDGVPGAVHRPQPRLHGGLADRRGPARPHLDQPRRGAGQGDRHPAQGRHPRARGARRLLPAPVLRGARSSGSSSPWRSCSTPV